MSRDPFFANAEAESLHTNWQPKRQCVDCHILTGTYSRIDGAIYCPVCAPSHRIRAVIISDEGVADIAASVSRPQRMYISDPFNQETP